MQVPEVHEVVLSGAAFALEAAHGSQEASHESQESTMRMPRQLLRGEHFTCQETNTMTCAYFFERLKTRILSVPIDQESVSLVVT